MLIVLALGKWQKKIFSYRPEPLASWGRVARDGVMLYDTWYLLINNEWPPLPTFWCAFYFFFSIPSFLADTVYLQYTCSTEAGSLTQLCENIWFKSIELNFVDVFQLFKTFIKCYWLDLCQSPLVWLVTCIAIEKTKSKIKSSISRKWTWS